MHNNNVYIKSFLPTFADFDCKMNFKPSAILNFLQEVASKHGEELKIGREDLLKKGIFNPPLKKLIFISKFQAFAIIFPFYQRLIQRLSDIIFYLMRFLCILVLKFLLRKI